MAPTKVPKKPLKIMEKPISKKTKKKNYQSFGKYIYKLLQTVAIEEKFSISRKSLEIMDNFVSDWLGKIAAEAGRLTGKEKKKTLSSREIRYAMMLLVPGELAKHADIEAIKAITKYNNSKL